jgi:DNA-binding winged helix-turn-helix (wHTH) protein/tetratricopeptide (TPR) repeat protein
MGQSLLIDAERNRLLVDGREVEVQPRVLNLLGCLCRRPGQLVSKEQLLDDVWGHRFITEGVIKTAMSELRTALGDDVKRPRWIETQPKRGYRYVGPAPATRGQKAPQALPVSSEVPLAQASGSMPAASAPTDCLVGREQALDELRLAWERAGRGQSAVLLVAGDAGMGKTALLSRFMHGLGEDAVVAVGQCAEAIGQGEPYLAVLEALSPLLTQQPALLAELRRIAPTWLSQMPWHVPLEDRDALAREVFGASQERMLREFAELIERLSVGQPWLLVLEDLHWADSATVQLIAHLARRRTGGRWLLLASYRPIDVIAGDHPLGDLRRELRVHGRIQELQLAGLEVDQLAQWTTMRLPGAEPPAAFLAELQRHTDGLPLFVERVFDELLQQGVIVEAAPGRWRFPASGHVMPLPPRLLELMERQIARLPPNARQLLEVAALAVNEFDDLVLAHVLAISAAEVRQQLDGLVRRRLWLLARQPRMLSEERIASTYGFQHALMRHAFEQRIPAASRVELHRRLGQAFEAVYAAGCAERAAERAEHAHQGREPLKAARWYGVAAQQALQRIAPQPALQLVDKGLAQLPGETGPGVEELRIGLLLTRMRALVVTQGYSVAEARACIEEAFRLVAAAPAKRQTLAVWHAALWTRHNAGQWAGRDEVLEGLERSNADDWAVAALAANAQGVAATHRERPGDALPHLQQALAIYREHRQPGETLPLLQDFEIDTVSHLYLCHVELGQTAPAGEAERALQRRIDEGVDPLSEAMALFFLAMGAQLLGAEKRLADLVGRAQALMKAREALPGAGPHGVMLGWTLCQAGELHTGLQRMRDSLQVYREQGSIPGRTLFEQMYARQLLNTGEPAQAAQALQRCEELNAIGSNMGWGEALRTQVACLARSGADRQKVQRALDEAQAYARERGMMRLLNALQQDRERLA